MKLDFVLALYPPLALLVVAGVLTAIGDPVPGYLGLVCGLAWLGIALWLWTTPRPPPRIHR